LESAPVRSASAEQARRIHRLQAMVVRVQSLGMSVIFDVYSTDSNAGTTMAAFINE
jgi:hypothetical protein